MVLSLKGTPNLIEKKACACRRMLDNVPVAKTGLRDIVLKLLNDRVKHQLFGFIDQIFDQCDQSWSDSWGLIGIC